MENIFIDLAMQCNNKQITPEEFKQKVGKDFYDFWFLNKKDCLQAWNKYLNSKKPIRKPKIHKEFIGIRCEYSSKGLKELNCKQREGKIIGESRDGDSYRVNWNGVNYASSYHKSFIKPIF